MRYPEDKEKFLPSSFLRYCAVCGTSLEYKGGYQASYCSDTGLPITTHFFRCPNATWYEDWVHQFWTHDDCEIHELNGEIITDT